MEEKISVGNRIKYLRESEGLTQKELAIKLGLKGETAIANYEAGYSIPKDEIKFRMCEIFNCSLDYLMCKSDIRKPEQQEDPLGLAKIGFNMKDYIPPTETQKAQIEELIKVIMKDNKKEK